MIQSVKEDTPSPTAGHGHPSTLTSRCAPAESFAFNAAPTFGYSCGVPKRQMVGYTLLRAGQMTCTYDV